MSDSTAFISLACWGRQPGKAGGGWAAFQLLGLRGPRWKGGHHVRRLAESRRGRPQGRSVPARIVRHVEGSRARLHRWRCCPRPSCRRQRRRDVRGAREHSRPQPWRGGDRGRPGRSCRCRGPTALHRSSRRCHLIPCGAPRRPGRAQPAGAAPGSPLSASPCCTGMRWSTSPTVRMLSKACPQGPEGPRPVPGGQERRVSSAPPVISRVLPRTSARSGPPDRLRPSHRRPRPRPPRRR